MTDPLDSPLPTVLLVTLEIEMGGGYCAVGVEVAPILHVMIGPIKRECHRLHMSVVRANVGSILEFKDDLVGFAVGNSDESGLIVSTAIVGRHQLIAIHVKDGDHLFRSA